MKNITAVIKVLAAACLVFLAAGCGKFGGVTGNETNFNDLIERDGVFYIGESDEAFTGGFVAQDGQGFLLLKGNMSEGRGQGRWVEYDRRASAVATIYFENGRVVERGNTKSGDTKVINGIECILVRAGTFIMGSPASEQGRNENEVQHRVILTRDFWISKYEITQAQYRKVMGENPAHFPGDNHPVEGIGWSKANDFAQRVGGRLPTEAQWEFAARGGNASRGFINSGSDNAEEVAWHSSNSGGKTQVVGQKKANELGIYDMSGNVWEWVNDWYHNYGVSARINPTGPGLGSSRSIRGGSWRANVHGVRVARRHNRLQDSELHNVGFRVIFE